MSRRRAASVETLGGSDLLISKIIEHKYLMLLQSFVCEGENGFKGREMGDRRSDEGHAPQCLVISTHPCLSITSPYFARTLFLQNMAGANGPGEEG